jgi:hypothetical protein
MDVLIGYHRHLVEGWLLVMLFNLLVPWVFKDVDVKRVFYTRIGYFAFWALWSMVVFSGLMVWIFAGRPMHFSVEIMMMASLLLPVLDGYRAIRLKRIWLAESKGVGFSSLITGIEILTLLVVTLLALRH